MHKPWNAPLKFTFQFNWKAALTVSIAFYALLSLGFWQLDRAEQKRIRQQTIGDRLSARPTPLEELDLSDGRPPEFSRVLLEGEYLTNRSVFLVNKFYQGQPGYEVFTVFKLKSTARTVIISRGWVAAGRSLKEPPNIDTPEGPVSITGIIHVPATRSFFIEQEIAEMNWPLRLHQLNIEKLASRLELPVFPFSVRLDRDSQGLLQSNWPTVDTRAERSTSYAWQWFGMAGILLLVTLVRSTNVADWLRSMRNHSEDHP